MRPSAPLRRGRICYSCNENTVRCRRGMPDTASSARDVRTLRIRPSRPLGQRFAGGRILPDWQRRSRPCRSRPRGQWQLRSHRPCELSEFAAALWARRASRLAPSGWNPGTAAASGSSLDVAPPRSPSCGCRTSIRTSRLAPVPGLSCPRRSAVPIVQLVRWECRGYVGGPIFMLFRSLGSFRSIEPGSHGGNPAVGCGKARASRPPISLRRAATEDEQLTLLVYQRHLGV
jgi:hypothetical protein